MQETIKCQCKNHLVSSMQRSVFAQNSRRRIRDEEKKARRAVNTHRKSPEESDIAEDGQGQHMTDPTGQIQALVIACLLVAALGAQEQSGIMPGCYVRLHGLNKQQHNGREGMVVKCEQSKVEVKLAEYTPGDKCLIRVNKKNLTLLPTYSVLRCKLMPHRTVEITHYPEPVTSWPATLTGTYFEYLGVEETATTEQIKAAFRHLSVVLHPDKNPNNVAKATELFKQIREAHEVLKDEQSRNQYIHTLWMQRWQRGQGQKRRHHQQKPY